MTDIKLTESQIIETIERLEVQIRDTRKRLEQARSEVDKQILARQIDEDLRQIEQLRAKLKG
jgi:hypothetical protein